MRAIRIAERDAADHTSILAEAEVLTHDVRMGRQGGLWNRRHTQRLGGQHEGGDIAAAVDRAVDAERFIRMHDGDMRGAEKVEVLQRLLRIGRLVAPGDAKRVVELEPALAPPFEINAAIFTRKRKIAAGRPST